MEEVCDNHATDIANDVRTLADHAEEIIEGKGK